MVWELYILRMEFQVRGMEGLPREREEEERRELRQNLEVLSK